jgi:hypothetical protein
MKEQGSDARMFWPEKRVKQAFQEARRDIRVGDELKALRIFHRRMEYFMKTSSDIFMSMCDNEACFVTARYERPMLEKDIAALSGASMESRLENPEGFLTMAVIQRGKKDSSRLVAEVCDHGQSYRTRIIQCITFLGDTRDPFAGAWENLNAWAEKNDLIFSGKKVQIVGIQGNPDTVAKFCERWNETYPVRFTPLLRKEAGAGRMDFIKYRKDKDGLELAENFYKSALLARLKIPAGRPGCIELPTEYPEVYLQEMKNIQKQTDGSFRDTGPTGAAYLKIINIALGDIFRNRQDKKNEGANHG